MKVHYPKLYNMAHLFTFNVFTDFKGSNNYILFISFLSFYCIFFIFIALFKLVKLNQCCLSFKTQV